MRMGQWPLVCGSQGSGCSRKQAGGAVESRMGQGGEGRPALYSLGDGMAWGSEQEVESLHFRGVLGAEVRECMRVGGTWALDLGGGAVPAAHGRQGWGEGKAQLSR